MTWNGTGSRLGARGLLALLGEWESGGSIYRDLADRIKLLVIDGRLPLGTRLPSERELATELRRSRSTVVAAYDALRAEGYVASRQGSGTVVRLPARSTRTTAHDFAHAVPPPIDGLREVMRQALEHVDRAVDGPGFDMMGDEVLRERIADRYTRAGVPTRSSQVLVTMGAQHAIGMIARHTVRRGDRVLAESPAYPHAHDAFRAVGAQIVRSPVEWSGWDETHLCAHLERSRFALAYLMPDFQNPTGASMAPETRAAVARAAAATGTPLVIDETTAELDIDRGWSDGPFSRHAEVFGAAVVTVGSLSKTMWGGLRLGWIRASSSFINHLARSRPAFDLGPPRLEQLVACELLPRFDDLMATRRKQLKERRDHLKTELSRHLPDWDAPVPAGGLSFWVGLGSPVSSALSLRSSELGLTVSAGPRFTVDGSMERFVRLPFTMPPEDLTAGVLKLAEVWANLEPVVDPRDYAWPSVV